MKKILFIITHLELGGAQRQLFHLIEGLDKDRYSVYVCCGSFGYLKAKLLEVSDVKVEFISSLRRQINLFYDLIAFFKIFLFIRKHKFDIVHTHSPKASILGRWAAFLAGVKNIVYTVHGWPFHGFMNYFSFHLFLLLERITAKITKKIILVSGADLQVGLDKKIAGPGKFFLVHCGIEIDKFDQIFKKRTQGSIDGKVIITVSSLKPQKGLNYFLRMAEYILGKGRSLKFLIAGDGPYREEVSRQIQASGLKKNVILEGWVDDVLPLFSKASVFVLSSLWEGLPLSVIEAAISGIPLVVTDTQGIRDIIDDNKNGIIVKPGDWQGLSKGVSSILDNYSDWQVKIRAYRERLDIEYWSKERMIKQIDTIYRQL
ncbi:MAG: glycosyltransferase family 4 protein [Candidatus Omnitrophica bacterium]|nr:glycosyltransferase family 4 protein [Candidatus Omnitrophota bacterium]